MTNRKTNIVPFEMKYLNEYYDGFNTEIDGHEEEVKSEAELTECA